MKKFLLTLTLLLIPASSTLANSATGNVGIGFRERPQYREDVLSPPGPIYVPETEEEIIDLPVPVPPTKDSAPPTSEPEPEATPEPATPPASNQRPVAAPSEPAPNRRPGGLPQTGGYAQTILVWVGVGLLTIALLLAIKKRKSKVTAITLLAATSLAGFGTRQHIAASEQSSANVGFLGGNLLLERITDIDFGVMYISDEDETYWALPYKGYTSELMGDSGTVPHFVRVSDRRGEGHGWQLHVRQDGYFTATTETKNANLEGATLRLRYLNVRTSLPAGHGITTYDVDFEPDGTLNLAKSVPMGHVPHISYLVFGGLTPDGKQTDGVQLFVPAATEPDPVQYGTTITWFLSTVVGND
ncbi:MAG: WxL domain-containing protein [Turicibacter sp.]|nr:WxL domain-containing protein [Turicibacter sp.]